MRSFNRIAFLAFVWITALPALSFASPAQAHARRIVSLSPNTTEILYGVGAFDRVVGVSRYCTYPTSVRLLPRVGGWQDSSVEEIASLRPDLVVMTDAQAPFIANHLQALGLKVLATPSYTIEDVYAAMELIGNATGNEQGAAALIARTRASLAELQTRIKIVSSKTMILCVSRTPGTLNDLYVATEGSYLVQLVTMAGGRSLASTGEHGYGKMSKEALLSLNPQVIIDLQHTNGAYLPEQTQEVWRQLPLLRAVQERHVYPVTDEFSVHASQFIANTGWEFGHLLHPEAIPSRQP